MWTWSAEMPPSSATMALKLDNEPKRGTARPTRRYRWVLVLNTNVTHIGLQTERRIGHFDCVSCKSMRHVASTVKCTVKLKGWPLFYFLFFLRKCDISALLRINLILRPRWHQSCWHFIFAQQRHWTWFNHCEYNKRKNSEELGRCALLYILICFWYVVHFWERGNCWFVVRL